MKAVPQVCDVIGGDCVGEHLSRELGGGGLVGGGALGPAVS